MCYDDDDGYNDVDDRGDGEGDTAPAAGLQRRRRSGRSRRHQQKQTLYNCGVDSRDDYSDNDRAVGRRRRSTTTTTTTTAISRSLTLEEEEEDGDERDEAEGRFYAASAQRRHRHVDEHEHVDERDDAEGASTQPLHHVSEGLQRRYRRYLSRRRRHGDDLFRAISISLSLFLISLYRSTPIPLFPSLSISFSV